MKGRAPRRFPAARARGFTLIELMFTIAVAAVLLGVGVPNLRTFILESRLSSQANELIASAYLTRSEAIKRRTTAVLCFSTNPDAATPDCDGDGLGGWIVFVDDADPDVASADDRNGEFDAGEPILQRRTAMPEGVLVGSVPAGNEGYLAYGASGAARQLAVGTPVTGVVLCDGRGNVEAAAGRSAARGILLPQAGRPRVTRDMAAIDGADLGGCP